MVQTINDRMSFEFSKLVKQEIEDIKEIMARGSLPDWEQYKFMAGRIAGLDKSLELLDEAKNVVYGIEKRED